MAYILFAADTDRPEGVHQGSVYVARCFEQRGRRTEVVDDGRVAMERIRTDGPNILVSRLMLPYYDGLELAQELTRRYPDGKRSVILLTVISAKAGSCVPLAEASSALVDAFIVEPWPRDRMQAVSGLATYHEQLRMSIAHLLGRVDAYDGQGFDFDSGRPGGTG
jgi:CheY-like chemotaxis protein